MIKYSIEVETSSLYWTLTSYRLLQKNGMTCHKITGYDALSFWRRGDDGTYYKRCLACAHLEARGIYLLLFSTCLSRAFLSFEVGRVPRFATYALHHAIIFQKLRSPSSTLPENCVPYYAIRLLDDICRRRYY